MLLSYRFDVLPEPSHLKSPPDWCILLGLLDQLKIFRGGHQTPADETVRLLLIHDLMGSQFDVFLQKAQLPLLLLLLLDSLELLMSEPLTALSNCLLQPLELIPFLFGSISGGFRFDSSELV